MRGLAGLFLLVMLGSTAVRAEGPVVPPEGWTDGYVIANGIRIHYEELLAKCTASSPGWSRSECEYWARSKRLYHPYLALRSMGERPAVSELFERITAPTLILKADAQGDDRTKNEEVAKILKNGRIVHVAGAGHCVHRDQMIQSLAVLREFLGSL